MLKKHELSNPRSCINRAQNDEPVFVLRANDAVAPSVVEFWAKLYGEEKAASPGGMTDEQVEKQCEARSLAEQMREWRRRNRA